MSDDTPATAAAGARTILRVRDVQRVTGLSRTTIWRKVQRGDFPAPVRIGKNMIGWYEDEVAAAQAELPRVHYAPAEAAA